MVVPRGLFIVFEGLDRSGKSTQCKMLLDFLQQQGRSARIQRYPDRSEKTTGPKIDHFLKTARCPYENPEDIHNLFSQNRKVLDPYLRESIVHGQTVIADRYSFSGIAYTVAKNVPFEFACETELGLLKPDLVIYLNADPAMTSKRDGFGDEALEKAEFQLRVYEQMKALVNYDFWVEVNALQNIDNVYEDIKSIVKDLIENHQELRPLQSFTLSDFNV